MGRSFSTNWPIGCETRRVDAVAMLVALLRHHPRGLLTGFHRLALRKWDQFTKPALDLEK